MKKVLFVLATLLITTPAMGIVEITCHTDGEDPGVCRIEYDFSSGETQKLRGVALNISVGNGTITGISDFKVGESGQVNKSGDPPKGFGIFPANFGRHISDPNDPDWTASGYTPAAEAGDKGAPTGIPSAAIVVELGSLYNPATPANSPDPTGTLCKITVSESCTVTITKEDLFRGGLVMEDSNSPGSDNLGSGHTCGVVVGCVTCVGDRNGDSWVTTLDNTPLWDALREARDDTESPIYTGGMYFQLPANGTYDCYDQNGDTWVTTLDNTPFWDTLREARDDTESPLYTGGMYYQCSQLE